MERNYNSQAFTPEEVEKGLHLDLIKYLLDYNTKSEGFYNEIHITTDGYCTIIEWETVSFDGIGGRFEYVDEDQVIMTEKYFPDNHYELCYDEEDYKERLTEFLEENPGYKQNEYGLWYNENDRIAAEEIDKIKNGDKD